VVNSFGLKSPHIIPQILFGIDKHLVPNTLPHPLIDKLRMNGCHKKSIEHNRRNRPFENRSKSGDPFKNAKAVLAKQGFTREPRISHYKKKDSGGWAEGLIVDMPLRAIIECNGSEGITALAVSGLSSDGTFRKYSDLLMRSGIPAVARA